MPEGLIPSKEYFRYRTMKTSVIPLCLQSFIDFCFFFTDQKDDERVKKCFGTGMRNCPGKRDETTNRTKEISRSKTLRKRLCKCKYIDFLTSNICLRFSCSYFSITHSFISNSDFRVRL